MSWIQSRDKSGGLLVVWSHGGGCLSIITTLTPPSRPGKRSRPWQLYLRMEFAAVWDPVLHDSLVCGKGAGAGRVWVPAGTSSSEVSVLSQSTVNMCCGAKWHPTALPGGKVNR